MSIIKSALDHFVASSDKGWGHDRTKSVGSSEIGQCARKTWYVKKEHPKDADYKDGWGFRVRGTFMENAFWAPSMAAKYGSNFIFGGEDQKTLIAGEISATPDGILKGLKKDALAYLGVRDIRSECIAVECKTTDPRSNLDNAKPNNVYQTHIQMGLLREQTKYKPFFALLSYTDSSSWDVVKEFAVEYDDKIYQYAKERAKKILTATLAMNLDPEGWIGGGSECRYCAYAKSCGVERRNLPFAEKPVDPQFAAEMADMVAELHRREAEEVVGATAVREQQLAIKDRLREKSIKTVPGVVQWLSVKGRTGYDNKAIIDAAKKAGVDVEQFKTQGEPSDRLLFK